MMSGARGCCAGGILVTALLGGWPARAQSDMHAPLDSILDLYVRDGYVYYQALRKERAALDRYVASLDIPKARIEAWRREDQQAFWLNGYNALVLQTVIDHYPIRVRSSQYPAKSIRQIPGAFEQVKHRIGGESLTLDEIEKIMIAAFGDARMLLALGRGAIGGGRLISESFQGSRLEAQLTRAVKECAARVACVKIDRGTGTLTVTPLVSWREDAFVKTFATQGADRWGSRAPIERAVAAMVYGHLFASEREFLAGNTFRMLYGEFDWRLNDLTGGIPD